MVIPVPFGAAEVSWTLDGRQNAGSVLDFVTFPAGSTFSIFSPGRAVVTDLFTDAIFTEYPSE